MCLGKQREQEAAGTHVLVSEENRKAAGAHF
jgi:hypothetical protein